MGYLLGTLGAVWLAVFAMLLMTTDHSVVCTKDNRTVTTVFVIAALVVALFNH